MHPVFLKNKLFQHSYIYIDIYIYVYIKSISTGWETRKCIVKLRWNYYRGSAMFIIIICIHRHNPKKKAESMLILKCANYFLDK